MNLLQGVKNKIIVEVLKEIEKNTEGGLIIPETVNKAPQLFGKVISIGEEVGEINVNDIICFHRNGGHDILLDNVVYKVLMDSEVYGVMKEESTTHHLNSNEF